MANYRSGRINEEVKKVVSSLIQNEIKDPRLTAMISVTSVEVRRKRRKSKGIKECKWIYKKRSRS